MITRVTPGFFSAAQYDRQQLRRYLLGITQGLALLTFPACAGLALLANQFVVVVLGQKWIAATLPLRLLALCAALRAVTTVFPNMLFAMRQSRFVMRITIVSVIVFPPAFYFGSRWGTSGIAWVWIIFYPLITAPYVWRTLASTHTSANAYLNSILPAFRATLLMTLMVVAVRVAMPLSWTVYSRFAISVVTGVLSYAAVLLLAERRHLRDAYQLLRRGETA
jgi:teichuronic acid exporter